MTIGVSASSGAKKKGKDKRKPGGSGRHIAFVEDQRVSNESASITSQQASLREAFSHLGADNVDQVGSFWLPATQLELVVSYLRLRFGGGWHDEHVTSKNSMGVTYPT